MKAAVLVGVILAVGLTATAEDMHVEREIPEGRVRGKVVHVLDGEPVEEYLGIPYAEPPVGKLRFRPPQPKKRWQDTLDATSTLTACPQVREVCPHYPQTGAIHA